LRNALWALRRALGDQAEGVLIATRDRVGLAGPPNVWVDAAAFREHVAAGELEAAVALSRGDVLAGLHEEWVYAYRDLHREALSELLERLAGAGRSGRRSCRRDRCDPQACESESTRGGRSASADRSLGPLGRPGRRAGGVRPLAGPLSA
jgi:hypothetical protein